MTRQQHRIIVWDCGGRRGRNEGALPKATNFETSESENFLRATHDVWDPGAAFIHVPEDQRLGYG